MDYNLDQSAAKKADVIFSKIEQKGKYLGIITRAEPTVSKLNSDVVGVDLSFKSDTGETADYLTLWTHNAKGTLPGFNALNAIMTCLRVRSLTATNGAIKKWQDGKLVDVTVPLYKDLMGKPIGFLFYMEEYPKNAGGTGWKPVINSVFDEHGFTASEILTKATKPETLDKMMTALKDRPMRGAKVEAHQSEHPAAQNANSPFDDDIPFAPYGKPGAGVTWREM